MHGRARRLFRIDPATGHLYLPRSCRQGDEGGEQLFWAPAMFVTIARVCKEFPAELIQKMTGQGQADLWEKTRK